MPAEPEVSPLPGPRHGARCGAALFLAVACLALAAPAPTRADEALFDRAIRQLAGACARDASRTCAERFFDLADANADGVADQGEIERLNAAMRAWTATNAQSLDPVDLRALQLGFVLVDTIGIGNGMYLYDEDGDGALSLEEASADFNLDDRPLPQLVQQRALVDWPSVRRRFGATAMVFDYLDIR
jgi:hypothetical protein